MLVSWRCFSFSSERKHFPSSHHLFRKWFDIELQLNFGSTNCPLCCVSAGELGLLQPPEALQDSHQRLPPGQVGERAYKGPLWDARVPGWAHPCSVMCIVKLRHWWMFRVNFVRSLCSSGGGRQTTIRPAGGLLGHRRHHVHTVSGWTLRGRLSTPKFYVMTLLLLSPPPPQAVGKPSFLWWNRRRRLWKPRQEPVPQDPGRRLWVWLSLLGRHLWFRYVQVNGSNKCHSCWLLLWLIKSIVCFFFAYV